MKGKRLEPTCKYAMTRFNLFKRRYGSWYDAAFELKAQYNLRDEEIEHILRFKAKDILEEWEIKKVLEYVNGGK